MRSRVIPAQITTVEDKIAGNLSLTQIILLLVPVLFISFFYALMPPSMSFVIYKIILSTIFSIISLSLAIRIKGKIIASWLVVILFYNLRPKYYLYNKNSSAGRQIIKAKSTNKQIKKQTKIQTQKTDSEPISFLKIFQLNQLLNSGDLNLIYKANRKGGLDVAFEKIAK